jgi:hypothetical protein
MSPNESAVTEFCFGLHRGSVPHVRLLCGMHLNHPKFPRYKRSIFSGSFQVRVTAIEPLTSHSAYSQHEAPLSSRTAVLNPRRHFSSDLYLQDRLCGLVVRVLGYRSGGPGSIPGTTRKKTSSGSGTGSTQPLEYKLRSYLIEK